MNIYLNAFFKNLFEKNLFEYLMTMIMFMSIIQINAIHDRQWNIVYWFQNMLLLKDILSQSGMAVKRYQHLLSL